MASRYSSNACTSVLGSNSASENAHGREAACPFASVALALAVNSMSTSMAAAETRMATLKVRKALRRRISKLER